MKTSLAQQLALALLTRRLTVATAESCTGGLVSDCITDVPGSSHYFRGGIVAYSNTAKEKLLGVDANTLAQHGAVSRETAEEMADGARRVFGTDLAVSITGIAGPDGGTPEKPIGLAWIGVSSTHGSKAFRCLWKGDRRTNKEASAHEALSRLLQLAESLPPRDSAE